MATVTDGRKREIDSALQRAFVDVYDGNIKLQIIFFSQSRPKVVEFEEIEFANELSKALKAAVKADRWPVYYVINLGFRACL